MTGTGSHGPGAAPRIDLNSDSGESFGSWTMGDDAAMAEAITAALVDPGPPGPRVERARAFAAEVAVDRYEALFREVAAANGDR